MVKLPNIAHCALLAALCVTSACTKNQSVKGAYEPDVPNYAQGVAVGATAGGLITGMALGGTASTGAVTGGIIGAAIGSHNDSEGAIQSLQAQGVNVIRLGDIVEFVVPVDILFDGGETELKREAHPMMKQIVALIQQYGKVNVSVEGYSDNVGSTFSQIDLSSLQAQAVTTFLWSHGINLQRMKLMGIGNEITVANDLTARGSGYNRRIEITLWRNSEPNMMNSLVAGQKEDCWAAVNPETC